MKINNLSYGKIEYRGNKMDKQQTTKEIVNQFYNVVRQQMPADGDFEEIKMSCKRDDRGEYFLIVRTFLNNRTNEYNNCLDISYVPDNKDFEMGMNLAEGSKVELLDFLGNDNNLNKIESYIISLRKKSDEK